MAWNGLNFMDPPTRSPSCLRLLHCSNFPEILQILTQHNDYFSKLSSRIQNRASTRVCNLSQPLKTGRKISDTSSARSIVIWKFPRRRDNRKMILPHAKYDFSKLSSRIQNRASTRVCNLSQPLKTGRKISETSSSRSIVIWKFPKCKDKIFADFWSQSVCSDRPDPSMLNTLRDSLPRILSWCNRALSNLRTAP